MSLNPILIGTRFGLEGFPDVLYSESSQSYSYWYSVRSEQFDKHVDNCKDVSILFLLVLGSVTKYRVGLWECSSRLNPILIGTRFGHHAIGRTSKENGSLNPILIGTRFGLANYDKAGRDVQSQSYSYWYSVRSREPENPNHHRQRCLNPILIGTRFGLMEDLQNDFIRGVSILFLLVLGSVDKNIWMYR